ncbi:MAG: GMC family oxidoreductase, partial [Myxococcales bacterium]|nr:GMC family oxidoreductase [Myxococcales bacterium]
MEIDCATQDLPELRTADVCIVGSGPAGVCLALGLVARGLRVTLLEGGSATDADPRTRSLAEVDCGDSVVPIGPDNRRRQLGGNAGSWGVHLRHSNLGGRLAPFKRTDFVERPGLSRSAWPIGYDDLLPFYRRANVLLGAGPFSYDVGGWANEAAPALPLVGGDVETTIFMFGNGRLFLDDYRQQLAASDQVQVLLRTNVIKLSTTRTGEVESALAVLPDGRTLEVRAHCFVLAAGGVESPQILFASTDHAPEGLGNRHDQLGRGFMDHPIVVGGSILPHDRSIFDRMSLYDLRHIDGTPVMAGLTMSDAYALCHGPNLSTWLFPRPRWFPRTRTRWLFDQVFRSGAG